MNTAQVTNVPGQSRAKRNRIAAYAKMAWSEAQQKTSHLRIHTTTQDMGGAQIKFFDTVEKREYAERRGGIQRTTATAQNTSKRGLVIKQYELATQTDISDIVDASLDVLEEAKKQTMNAQGRLLDKIILDAVISDSLESTDGAEENDTISATITTARRRKNPLYIKGSRSTGAKAFASDDLDDVRLIFGKREVEANLCCTLTPELENILRKDEKFQNAENLFSAAIGGDPYRAGLMASQRHFRFKGFSMVYTYGGRLPVISTHNIGGTALGTNNLQSTVTCAALGLDRPARRAVDAWYTDGASDITARAVSSTAAAFGTSDTTPEKGLTRCTFKSEDVIHFWAPEAVYFAERQSLVFNRESELPLFSYAKQVYSRVAFGAMVIDDEYVLSLITAGNVINASPA